MKSTLKYTIRDDKQKCYFLFQLFLNNNKIQNTMTSHSWHIVSHSKPTFCNICREALSGMYYYRGSSNSAEICPKNFARYPKPRYLNLYYAKNPAITRNRTNYTIKSSPFGTKNFIALW